MLKKKINIIIVIKITEINFFKLMYSTLLNLEYKIFIRKFLKYFISKLYPK